MKNFTNVKDAVAQENKGVAHLFNEQPIHLTDAILAEEKAR